MAMENRNGEKKPETRMFENERAEHHMSEKKEKTIGIIVAAVIVVVIVACIALKFGWLQEYWAKVNPG